MIPLTLSTTSYPTPRLGQGLGSEQPGADSSMKRGFKRYMRLNSEKAGLKLNTQKTKIMASGPITSWQISVESMENTDRLYFLGLQNHYSW